MRKTIMLGVGLLLLLVSAVNARSTVNVGGIVTNIYPLHNSAAVETGCAVVVNASDTRDVLALTVRFYDLQCNKNWIGGRAKIKGVLVNAWCDFDECYQQTNIAGVEIKVNKK